MTKAVLPLLVAALAVGVIFFGIPLHVTAQDDGAVDEAQVTHRLQEAVDLLEVRGYAPRTVYATDSVEIVAVLRDQVDVASLAADTVHASRNNPHARGRALYTALVEKAERTQAPLRAWLDARGVPYRAYYIVNMLVIQGDAALVTQLRTRPEIERLALNVATEALNMASAASPFAALPPAWRIGSGGPQSVAPQSVAPPWGLTYIHAPEVWAMGYTGEGIVVASQDTGVQWNHPALQAAYRGWDSVAMTVTHTYNWFDAWGADANRATRCTGDAATNAQIPCDDNGHGTHTVGTMVGNASGDGGTVLGVAPDAEWIGCRNMTAGVGSPTSYADCFQFFLAPYPQGGDPMTDGDPSLAPHIINNSWSCPAYEGCDDPDILRDVVEAARAAGQFVAASAGNDGYNGCSTISTPIAIYDASFSVGSVDANGALSDFSSRGPVLVDGSNRVKPDIAAPGSGVDSAYPTDSYASLSGTSMAAPHVAGAVALLWSAAPQLIGDIDQTEAILAESATPAAYSGCGPAAMGGAANNGFGSGYLNVNAAVLLALQVQPRMYMPFIACSGEACHTVAGSLPFVPKPSN